MGLTFLTIFTGHYYLKLKVITIKKLRSQQPIIKRLKSPVCAMVNTTILFGCNNYLKEVVSTISKKVNITNNNEVLITDKHIVTPGFKYRPFFSVVVTGQLLQCVRVKCLAQDHSTMSPARARTRSARSGVERANHEATAPPTVLVEKKKTASKNAS